MKTPKTYKINDELSGIGKWRVYFNRQGTLREAFSVDLGQGRPRRHFRELTISTGSGEAYFRATGKPPNGIDPIAWIEIFGELHAFKNRRGGHEALIIGRGK